MLLAILENFKVLNISMFQNWEWHWGWHNAETGWHPNQSWQAMSEISSKKKYLKLKKNENFAKILLS